MKRLVAGAPRHAERGVERGTMRRFFDWTTGPGAE